MSNQEPTFVNQQEAIRQSGVTAMRIRGAALRGEVRIRNRPGRCTEFCVEDVLALAADPLNAPYRPRQKRQTEQPAGA
jgi:hypothetical protein